MNAAISLTQRAYHCLKCLYILSGANIGEILHEADITAGLDEPSAGQMELHTLMSEACGRHGHIPPRDECRALIVIR